MSWAEWYKNLGKKKRKKVTVDVPATFNPMEEAKIATRYDKMERKVDKQMAARRRHRVYYQNEDGEEEASVGDETMRQFMEESVFGGGIIGEEFEMTHDQWRAFVYFKMKAESLQAQYGKKYPYTQTISRILRTGKDVLDMHSVTREDTGFNRVVVPSGTQNPFGDINVDLSNSKRVSKEELEYFKSKERESEEKRA